VALERGHLDRLVLADLDRLEVAEERHRRRHDQAGDECRAQRAAGEVLVALLEQVPCRDAGDDEATGDPCRGDDVQQPRHGRRVEHGGPEVGEHRAAVDDLVAARRLHPRVGDEDPQRREMRADEHEPRRDVVHPA
jgi:hypothetical protein